MMKRQNTERILSPNILERFNKIGCQKDISNPLVITKLIESTGSIDMYLTQYNPKNKMAYGFVVISFMDLVDAEFKTIDMNILEEMKQSTETQMVMDSEFVECHLNDCVDTDLYIEK